MTQDHLAALSEAATQAMQAVEANPHGTTIDAYITASGAYHAELERLHRANQLVLIGPDAVERCARAICIAQGDDPNREGPWAEWWEESPYASAANAFLAAFTGRV